MAEIHVHYVFVAPKHIYSSPVQQKCPDFLLTVFFLANMFWSQHLTLSFAFSCVDVSADMITTEQPNPMTDSESVDSQGIVYCKRSVILT